jgi:hypothetical protein
LREPLNAWPVDGTATESAAETASGKIAASFVKSGARGFLKGRGEGLTGDFREDCGDKLRNDFMEQKIDPRLEGVNGVFPRGKNLKTALSSVAALLKMTPSASGQRPGIAHSLNSLNRITRRSERG